jgi:hypothetical protein
VIPTNFSAILIAISSPSIAQGPANKKFYDAFLKGDAPKMTLAPDGNLNCKDLIELFWQGK